jgi:hypothetical protein
MNCGNSAKRLVTVLPKEELADLGIAPLIDDFMGLVVHKHIFSHLLFASTTIYPPLYSSESRSGPQRWQLPRE